VEFRGVQGVGVAETYAEQIDQFVDARNVTRHGPILSRAE
jgi:hypothetical protein